VNNPFKITFEAPEQYSPLGEYTDKIQHKFRHCYKSEKLIKTNFAKIILLFYRGNKLNYTNNNKGDKNVQFSIQQLIIIIIIYATTLK